MKSYEISASNMTATYGAGKFIANSAAEAIEKAKEKYRKSPVGRELKDVGAFRFYVTDEETING
jgi:hypothetical protein